MQNTRETAEDPERLQEASAALGRSRCQRYSGVRCRAKVAQMSSAGRRVVQRHNQLGGASNPANRSECKAENEQDAVEKLALPGLSRLGTPVADDLGLNGISSRAHLLQGLS